MVGEFNRLFEAEPEAISEGDVIKPLANEEGLRSRPSGVRTPDTLIRRHGVELMGPNHRFKAEPTNYATADLPNQMLSPHGY